MELRYSFSNLIRSSLFFKRFAVVSARSNWINLYERDLDFLLRVDDADIDKPEDARTGVEVSVGLIWDCFSRFSITVVPSKSVSFSTPGNENNWASYNIGWFGCIVIFNNSLFINPI